MFTLKSWISRNYTFNKLRNTRNALYKCYAFYRSLFALSFFKVQTTYKKESPYKKTVLQKALKGKYRSFFYLIIKNIRPTKNKPFYKRQKGKYRLFFILFFLSSRPTKKNRPTKGKKVSIGRVFFNCPTKKNRPTKGKR